MNKNLGLFIDIYIYIYIYEFTKLLSTSIHGYLKKRKKEKKNPLGSRDNNISNYRPGENEKKYHRRKKKKKKKKEKANFVTPVEKNQEIYNQLVKRKKKHRKMLQRYNYRECSIQSRANYKN